MIFESHLGETKNGNKKSKEQKNAIHNIKMPYEARDKAIKLYDDYSSMVFEAKN